MDQSRGDVIKSTCDFQHSPKEAGGARGDQKLGGCSHAPTRRQVKVRVRGVSLNKGALGASASSSSKWGNTKCSSWRRS